jgi:hypothetical protein
MVCPIAATCWACTPESCFEGGLWEQCRQLTHSKYCTVVYCIGGGICRRDILIPMENDYRERGVNFSNSSESLSMSLSSLVHM